MWNKTGVTDLGAGSVEEISFARHATTIETAIAIAKAGAIWSSHEKQPSNALYRTGYAVVWLSPNDWQYAEGNVYGCVAFDYDWKRLIDYYGDRAYGLQEVASTTPTARILLTNFDHGADFGQPYNPSTANVPWRVVDGTHFIKKNCVLQIAVDTAQIGLHEFARIVFIDQKRGLKGEKRLHADTAARLFLCRVVGEQIRSVPNFAGVDPQTHQPHECMVYACRHLWYHLGLKYQGVNGPVHHEEPTALPLARALMDRLGRLPAFGYQESIFSDSDTLASMFHSLPDLVLSCRLAIGKWAGIADLDQLNTDTWPING